MKSIIAFTAFIVLHISVYAQAIVSYDEGLPDYDEDRLSYELTDPSLFIHDYVPMSADFGSIYVRRFGFIANNRRGYDFGYGRTTIDGVFLNDALTGRPLWNLMSQVRRSDFVTATTRKMLASGDAMSPFSHGEQFNLQTPAGDYIRLWTKYASTQSGAGGGCSFIWSTSDKTTYGGRVEAYGGRDSNMKSLDGSSYSGSLFWNRSFKKSDITFYVLIDQRRRDQRQFITRYVAELADDNLYNPVWGWNDGKRLNSNQKDEFSVMAVAKYGRELGEHSAMRIVVCGGVQSADRSRLSWFNARDPRPDYYMYLPQELDGEQRVQWRNHAQLDWEYMYHANRMSDYARYFMEGRMEDTKSFQALAAFDLYRNRNLTIEGGARARIQSTDYYKRLRNLLGATYLPRLEYVDLNDYQLTEDLWNGVYDTSDRIIEGNKFGYNYTLTARSVEYYAGFMYKAHPWVLRADLVGGIKNYQRNGRYEKSEFEGAKSVGKSSVRQYDEAKLSFGVGYQPTTEHSAELKVMYAMDAPAVTGVFVYPRYRNEMVGRKRSVEMSGAELRYTYMGRNMTAVVGGYFTKIANLSSTYSYYDDLQRTYADMYMYGIGQRNYGIEVSLATRISSAISLQAMVSVGSHVYDGNPSVDISDNGDGRILESNLRADLNGFRVGNVAGRLFSASADYNRNLWIVSLSATVASDRHVEPTPLRRMERVYSLYSDELTRRENVTQERLPTSASVDLFVQKTFKIGRRNRNFISVYAVVNNLLARQNNVFAAYESMRVYAYRRGDQILQMSPQSSNYLYSGLRAVHVGVSLKFK